MERIAVVTIAYNRVSSLRRLLNSLEKGCFDPTDNVPLIISVDKSDSDEVERFADEYAWNFGDKTVIRHQRNLGLKAHVLSQGRWLDEYDAIVVLEDDVAVAPDFWYYVRQCVRRYQDDDRIAGVSLYGFSVNYHSRHPFIPLHVGDNDVYFMNCAMSWGQVWMRKSWKAFEAWYQEHATFEASAHLPQSICSWSEKSWLKYHTRYCIEENKYFVFPYVSYSTNFGDCGIHMATSDTIFQVPLLQGENHRLALPAVDGTEVAVYDGFFENKRLYESLGLAASDCCLDLNGTHPNREKKRYWLTTRILPYKVVKRFALAVRPIELNVFMRLEGDGVYLYDTTIADDRRRTTGNPAFLNRYFVQNAFLFLREYGYVNVARDFWRVLKAKFFH